MCCAVRECRVAMDRVKPRMDAHFYAVVVGQAKHSNQPNAKGGACAMPQLHNPTQRSTVLRKSHLHSPCLVREDLHVAQSSQENNPFSQSRASPVHVVLVGALFC